VEGGDAHRCPRPGDEGEVTEATFTGVMMGENDTVKTVRDSEKGPSSLLFSGSGMEAGGGRMSALVIHLLPTECLCSLRPWRGGSTTLRQLGLTIGENTAVLVSLLAWTAMAPQPSAQCSVRATDGSCCVRYKAYCSIDARGPEFRSASPC